MSLDANAVRVAPLGYPLAGVIFWVSALRFVAGPVKACRSKIQDFLETLAVGTLPLSISHSVPLENIASEQEGMSGLLNMNLDAR